MLKKYIEGIVMKTYRDLACSDYVTYKRMLEDKAPKTVSLPTSKPIAKMTDEFFLPYTCNTIDLELPEAIQLLYEHLNLAVEPKGETKAKLVKRK